LRAIYTKKRTVYQDRLETNIGKALKKWTVCPQAEERWGGTLYDPETMGEAIQSSGGCQRYEKRIHLTPFLFAMPFNFIYAFVVRRSK